MLMRRKTRPVAVFRKSNAGHDSARLNVSAGQNIEVAFHRRLSGREMKRRILSDFFERDKLKRIFILDRGRDFGEIATVLGRNLNRRIARHVDRVIPIEILIAGSESDATVMKPICRGVFGRHADVAT